jgi:transposase-like protein
MSLAPFWLKHFDPPVCPQCAQKMMVVRVQPKEPWVMSRKFKCRTCLYTETDLVKYGRRFQSR